MLCIVCTRPIPIPNFQDENKLCQSCISRIKLRSDLKEGISIDELVTIDKEDSTDKLDNLQNKLWHDLNLEGDSDYEAELNYLKEAKKALILSRQKNIQSVKEYHGDQYKEQNFESKSSVLTKECLPEFSNVAKKKVEHTPVHDSLSRLQFCDPYSTHKNRKLPELHGGSQPVTVKEKANRRVAINNSVIFSIVSVKKPDKNSNQSLFGTAATACRAVFHPTHEHPEPFPMFEKIHSVERQREFTTERNMPLAHGYKNPFTCPVTICKNIIPVSDLIKHFKLNHIRVPIVPVNAGACTNFFWEAKVDQFGMSQCLMLLLTTGKFKEFGYGQYKDCLPVAVMTTKIKFSELADVKSEQDDDGCFYMIWLTAMCSSEETVYYTLSAWSDRNDSRVHIVNSGQSYAIRDDQNPKIVYGSGKAMILTSEQINKLSNSNEEMVKLQVVVH